MRDGASQASFRARFKAWWDGTYLPAGEADDGADGGADEIAGGNAPAAAAQNTDYWCEARLAFLQRLWGADMVETGGKEMALALATPLAPDPKKSLLDITARNGGTGRAVAEELDTWITGLETDKWLAEQAMAESVRKGLRRKVPVDTYELSKLALQPKYDGVFGREMLYAVADKHGLLAQLANGLKPGGQILFTDLMKPLEAPPSNIFKEWLKAEPFEAQPWTVDECVKALEKAGLELRIKEDMTAEYKRLLLEAWSRLSQGGSVRGMPRGERVCMLEEAELCGRRIAAFDSSDLVVYRMVAIKPAKKDEIK